MNSKSPKTIESVTATTGPEQGGNNCDSPSAVGAQHPGQSTVSPGEIRTPETERLPRANGIKKVAALYCTMVAVSTGAIFLLEHASLIGAFRTALVAAVGKTFAAHWVSGFFD